MKPNKQITSLLLSILMVLSVTMPVMAETNSHAEQSGKAFAKAEVELNGARDPGRLTQETNLGDLSSDAILWSANRSAGVPVNAAILSGGSIRKTLPAGDITLADLKAAFSSEDQIAVIKITGQDILEALEASTYCTPTALDSFPQVAGITFTLDTTQPYKKGDSYGSYYKCANPGTRIKNVTIAGQPLDLKKTYHIATTDSAAAGKGTCYSFKEAYAKNGINTKVALDDALAAYISTVLDNVIPGSLYGGTAGRIDIIAPRGAAAVSSSAAEGTSASAPATVPTAPPKSASTSASTSASASTYTVHSGDYLWKISRKTYGRGARWPEIYDLNKEKIANPDLIYPGEKLKLPVS